MEGDLMIHEKAVKIVDVKVSAYTIPTETPEADGTLSWNSTTIIIVEIEAGDKKGIGYTYADQSAASFIQKNFSQLLLGANALDIGHINLLLTRHLRNSGNCGIAMMALSAVDSCLWDLKAKLLNVPLCTLLGQVKEKMLLYGSGGFTNYSKEQLQGQFTHWASQGIRHLKMKVGTHPNNDVQRVKDARHSVDEEVKLMIDANGAYSIKQALQIAEQVQPYNVMWFEEPVSSDDLAGLHYINHHAPTGINIAAGEYGYNLPYFKSMLAAGAVNILQADATRCGGITGFLKAGHLAEAWPIPFSSHCAPALHLHAAVCLPCFFIAEYFFDHVRIEQMLFDGAVRPQNGSLVPDLTRCGLGISLKEKDAEPYKV